MKPLNTSISYESAPIRSNVDKPNGLKGMKPKINCTTPEKSGMRNIWKSLLAAQIKTAGSNLRIQTR